MAAPCFQHSFSGWKDKHRLNAPIRPWSVEVPNGINYDGAVTWWAVLDLIGREDHAFSSDISILADYVLKPLGKSTLSGCVDILSVIDSYDCYCEPYRR